MKQSRNLGFVKPIIGKVKNMFRLLPPTSVHWDWPLSIYDFL